MSPVLAVDTDGCFAYNAVVPEENLCPLFRLMVLDNSGIPATVPIPSPTLFIIEPGLA